MCDVAVLIAETTQGSKVTRPHTLRYLYLNKQTNKHPYLGFCYVCVTNSILDLYWFDASGALYKTEVNYQSIQTIERRQIHISVWYEKQLCVCVCVAVRSSRSCVY